MVGKSVFIMSLLGRASEVLNCLKGGLGLQYIFQEDVFEC